MEGEHVTSDHKAIIEPDGHMISNQAVTSGAKKD
jgi:hypothetical protein